MSLLQQNAKLLAVSRPVTFAAGERLVRQGEPARGAFIIGAGVVEAQVAMPGGGMLTVAELGEGDIFGEMALVERGVCSATVTARAEVRGWFVEREDFRALVASRDPAALELQRTLTQVLAGKLRALNAKVREHPAAEDRAARTAPLTVDLSKSEKPSFDWRAFLPLLRFFEGFEPADIDTVAAIGRALELPRGAALFASGQAAETCYLVVRGAVEVLSRNGNLERRVAVAGPGELVGYLAALDGTRHAAAARVRERACLLELPARALAALYEGHSSVSVKLQHAIHASLLRSLARTNNLLTRLISHAKLAARPASAELEAALHGQLFRPDHNVNS
jgi:CRP-like cAMP-binding protein